MTTHPTPAELEQELANLQRQLQELAEQDAAERRQLAARLEGLAQQLDALDALNRQRHQALEQARAARERIQELEQQVRDLQAQLEQRQRQAQDPRPAAAEIQQRDTPSQAAPTSTRAEPTQAAVAPASRGRQLVLGTAGLGLLLGLGLGVHHQLRQRNPAAAPEAAATTMLELQADQPSWLEVRSNSGQNLFVGELQGSKRFAIGTGLQVLAGRPDLVTVRLGTAPPRPLGRIEDVDWHRFSPGGSATQEPQQSNQGQDQDERGQQQN